MPIATLRHPRLLRRAAGVPQHIMRRIGLAAALCTGLYGGFHAYQAQACELPFGGELTIDAPLEIIVPPGTAIGARVAGPYYSTPPYTSESADCAMGWTSSGEWTIPTSEWMNFIHTTNIPGIGVRVHRHSEGRQGEAYPFRIFSASEQASYDRHHHVVEFFRIGSVVDGTLTPGRYVAFSRNGHPGTALLLGPIRFVEPEPTCDFSQGRLEVPLGEHTIVGFSGVGATPLPWTRFVLHSGGCQYASTVHMRFLGSSDPDDSGLFAISGGASGVGIEVQTEAGDAVRPNAGSPVVLPVADTPVDLAFRARYRQTRPAVIPGPANATATVLLEYH